MLTKHCDMTLSGMTYMKMRNLHNIFPNPMVIKIASIFIKSL